MLLVSLCVVACATLGGPHQVNLPLGRLQAGLDKHFPVDQRIFEMFQIRLSQPRLATLPEQERLSVAIAAAVATPLTPQSWTGSLVLTGKLAIDTARSAIVLREARVERLAADGMDETRQRLLAKTASLVAERILPEIVLYTFKADELRHLGTQYRPIAIRPTADALRITFEPVR